MLSLMGIAFVFLTLLLVIIFLGVIFSSFFGVLAVKVVVVITFLTPLDLV